MSKCIIASVVANVTAAITSLISGVFWLLSTQTTIPSLISLHNKFAAIFSVATALLFVAANFLQMKSKS